MKKTLTPKEQELIPKVRDEWSNLFFSLKFNEKDAKELINFMYELAGLDKPKIVILDSPMEVQKSANQCDEEFDGIIRHRILVDISEKIFEKICVDVKKEVIYDLWDEVNREIMGNINYRINYKIRNELLDEVYYQRTSKYIPDLNSCGIVEEFGCVAFYDYFQRIGIFKDETFTKYKDLIKANIFYIIPFEKTCFISRPPLYIKRDKNGELHSEKGYAIEFKDGWGLRYIHGEFVEEDGE
jgi:hypothetical protein